MTEIGLEPLLTESQIQERVTELAKQIAADYGETQVLLVAVLRGSIHFVSDLARRIGRADWELDFIQVRSYQSGRKSSGVVQIRKDLDTNLEGRDVLIVEDVVDTGATLAHLRELLGTRRPKSLRVVALLVKEGAIRAGTQVEYMGFRIPDAFVVGYGLDYDERYRHLPYVAILP
ncbi:MAG: hypoxanthine phosphoribosyltransferase [Fimbriimonas ginsengisoli]|uniref:Hypoxanthine phosphoribosyltransferase n=1 Tax=Fimbriimonas ginsengisoli TaxID=1005039 RepID=A0A931LTJ8_FIMGI|nr:hypoxanthine phosphoribosyltransferase [Fimbriimonas ginsengisoli]MBI3722060.1 hypoxanthine phosphoribosyltransferase [Fimbriimonas ginsengisoli]